MIKAGIISMQRIANYGSFLQAYGLKKILENKSCIVTFVDFRVKKPISISNFSFFKKRIVTLMFKIISKVRIFDVLLPKGTKHAVKFYRVHQKDLKEYLNITKKNYETSVDFLIIGSDEVFNCTQDNANVGYSLDLFGLNSKSNCTFSYAASFGNTTYEKIKKYNIENDLGRCLTNLKYISVRDNNSCEIVKKISGINPLVHLDPVLIYDFSKEIIDCPLNEGFCIVYAYKNRITEDEKKAIIEFANLHNKKIVCIGGYQNFGDMCFNGTAFEVLGYFKKADFVITDTFHGTIMSIINQKKFATFIRKSSANEYGNSEKLNDLLLRLGLSDRAVNSPNELEILFSKDINYDNVQKIIQIERKRTIDYFDSIFNNS